MLLHVQPSELNTVGTYCMHCIVALLYSIPTCAYHVIWYEYGTVQYKLLYEYNVMFSHLTSLPYAGLELTYQRHVYMEDSILFI